MTYLSCTSANTAHGPTREPIRIGERARLESNAGSADGLYSEFAPILAGMIRRLSDDVETRKDLTGEAYIAFRALIDRYDPGRGIPLRPYVISQVKAHLYSRCRSRRGVYRREFSLGANHPCEFAAVDPTPSWDREMEMKRVVSALPDMLRLVPERQRRVLVWRYFDEVSFEEIASRLGIQPATARSLLRHGIRKLRNLAAENLEPSQF